MCIVHEIRFSPRSIHGSFRLPKVAFKVIDTPQFQRLRHLKQTGTVDLVYPNAVHNR